ncbi:MAG: type II secretion system protein GspG [Kiritimatiellia bacterium]
MRTDTNGFTLIEVLAVVAIMGILLAIVAGLSSYANRAAKESRARACMEELYSALEEYAMEYGEFPAGTNSADLAHTAVTNRLAPDFEFTDPWGEPYGYIRRSADSCGLFSKGRDRVEGTGDDIRPEK